MSQSRSLPLACHIGLLSAFVCAIGIVWVLPVLIAGDAYDVFPLLAARNFAATGLFSVTDEIGRFLSPSLLPELGMVSASDGRLSTIFLSFLSKNIAWTDLVSWTFVSAMTIGVSLIAWWWAVYKFFNARIAWTSTVIFALLPIYWRQAIWLDNYNFAILFLCISFATFAELVPRSRIGGFIVAGAFYGLAISAKDTFIMFLPWYVGLYVWQHRTSLTKDWIHGSMFLLIAFSMYCLPYIGDIAVHGYPANQNLAQVWPGDQVVQEDFYLHLYPDPYTYFFDRERYDGQLLEQLPQLSTLERIQKYKILLNFGVGEFSQMVVLGNGLWLFAGAIPAFFQQELMGGVFLWLFIIPGAIFLWRKERHMALALFGLVLSSELLIRFILHYARGHLMDYGWALALCAAFGVAVISDKLSASSKKVSSNVLSGIIVFVIAVQLVQANRVWIPRMYKGSQVPTLKAVSAHIHSLPRESVVALGVGPTRSEQIAYLSNRTVVPFAPSTIFHLSEQGTLNDVFDQYGVTHVYGYPDDLTMDLKRAVRSVEVIPVPTKRASISSTPFLRYLLHLVR